MEDFKMTINYKGEVIKGYGRVNNKWYAVVNLHMYKAATLKELCAVIGVSATALRRDVNRHDIEF